LTNAAFVKAEAEATKKRADATAVNSWWRIWITNVQQVEKVTHK
jgi:hypothetical protein